eukprot:6174078-Pleurochrysis_carterae.AAC.1
MELCTGMRVGVERETQAREASTVRRSCLAVAGDATARARGVRRQDAVCLCAAASWSGARCA